MIMKVIAVKTVYNTDANNEPVPEGVPFDELPCVYHGPFDSIADAKHWVDYVYPDGDTDVEDQFVDEYEVEEEWLNDPAIYDEDIRD